ncbi:unnamed protein product [Parnassius mnemosyne]|uniref:MD-2-related lipid-recognition domain-containing protein n=1 Tax=Parnassius mnemosyne TaxID=213953 RepID=A0AAV1KK54_9NEOP
MLWIKIVCVLALMSSSIYSLKLIFERVEVTYVDTNYYEYVFANVTRYGRRSDYYLNIEFKSIYAADNNVTVHILYYEFRRNQYRRSFIEGHYKLCDFLIDDPYIGVFVSAVGFECPVKAAIYIMPNVTIPMGDFPNVFPFEKGRIDATFEVTATRKPLVESKLYLTFKNEVKSKKRG